MQRITIQDDDLDFEPQITKDEWQKILVDEDFMSLNYKFFLIAFF